MALIQSKKLIIGKKNVFEGSPNFFYQDVDLDVCIKEQREDDCDLFLKEDCAYDESNLVFEADPGSIVDAPHCQDLCELFAASLQCNYWVYEDAEFSADNGSHCSLYKAVDLDTCKTVLGPKSVPVADCKSPTSTRNPTTI